MSNKKKREVLVFDVEDMPKGICVACAFRLCNERVTNYEHLFWCTHKPRKIIINQNDVCPRCHKDFERQECLDAADKIVVLFTSDEEDRK